MTPTITTPATRLRDTEGGINNLITTSSTRHSIPHNTSSTIRSNTRHSTSSHIRNNTNSPTNRRTCGQGHLEILWS